MCRKLLVLSSLIVAMGAVTFDVSEAEAGRCCRNRGRRCCNGGWGGCHGGCGYACNTGCHVGCAPQVAYNNCCAVQPCSFQGGCPIGGRLIANPNAPPAAPPPGAPAPQPTVEPLAPPPPQ